MLAGIGRWCFGKRWWVLGAWLAAVVAGLLAAGTVFGNLANGDDVAGVEASQAYDQLGSGDETGGEVLALVDGIDPRSSTIRVTILDTVRTLAGRTDVESVAHPYGDDPRATALFGRDGTSVLITVTLRASTDEDEDDALADVTDRLHALATQLHDAGAPDARVRIGGNKLLNRQANEQVQADLRQAELISLPLTLVVLVVVFGGLVAAGLPVLSAVVSVAAAMVVLLGFSYVTDLDQNTVTVVTLLGLGLSIDYGLLLVARYREELGAGGAAPVDVSPRQATATVGASSREAMAVEALGRAWATAGRTVLFSALTVGAALAGLLMFDIGALAALGAAGVSIAVVSMLAALTFTAALIGFAHRRIKPRAKRPAHAVHAVHAASADEVGFFAGLSRFVQRRPWLVAIGASVGLLAAGVPLLTATINLPRLDALPRSLEAVQVADALADDFGRREAPTVLVVARTDPATLDRWAGRWATDPAVAEVRPARAAGDGVARVEFALHGDGQDDLAQGLVHRLRGDRPPGERSWVTGDAAFLVDLNAVIKRGLPLATGITVLAMVLLLFAMTGSVVVPVKAIVANVVSLGATFGVLVAVFEHGWGAGLLNTLTVGGLSPFIVVIVFAFAFGLSMDYEVFLLGRIKEYVDQGMDSDTAVRRGLQHTGRIITSAALLMVIVFVCFAFAEMGQIEQVGLGLTVAVLIDATVVRCLLVPATMTLLGRWNWYAPAPLKRLHAKWGISESTPMSTSRELVHVPRRFPVPVDRGRSS